MKYLKKSIINIIEFGNDMNRHNAASYASSVAFFFFFSMFPSLMFLFSLIPKIGISEYEIISYIDKIIPSSLEDTVYSILDDIYSSSFSLISITAIATLWTAGMGVQGLIRGLNGILDIEDKRNYFLIRLFAVFYTLGLLFIILLSIIIMGFGGQISEKLIEFIPSFGSLIRIVSKLRGVIVFLVLMIFFAIIYAFLPAKKNKLFLQLPGALIASLGWCVGTWAMGIYVDFFNGFSVYGSISVIIVVLSWFYMCFYLLIFGAFLNKYYKPMFFKGYKVVKEKYDIRKEDKHMKRKNSKNQEDNQRAIEEIEELQVDNREDIRENK